VPLASRCTRTNGTDNASVRRDARKTVRGDDDLVYVLESRGEASQPCPPPLPRALCHHSSSPRVASFGSRRVVPLRDAPGSFPTSFGRVPSSSTSPETRDERGEMMRSISARVIERAPLDTRNRPRSVRPSAMLPWKEPDGSRRCRTSRRWIPRATATSSDGHVESGCRRSPGNGNRRRDRDQLRRSIARLRRPSDRVASRHYGDDLALTISRRRAALAFPRENEYRDHRDEISGGLYCLFAFSLVS